MTDLKSVIITIFILHVVQVLLTVVLKFMFFSEVKPQDEQGDVIFQSAWGWTGKEDEYSDVDSKMVIKGDTIIMHYSFKLYVEPENGKRKTKKQIYLDASYTKQNGKWITTDPTEIKDFWYMH
jgi:hypothetical protein